MKKKNNKPSRREIERLSLKFGYGEEQGYPEIVRFEDMTEEEQAKAKERVKSAK